jgi:hypothetical protein
MKLRRIGLALAMVLLLGGMAFAQDTIRIGVFLPLTGQNAFGGQLELDGVRMAHEEVAEVLGKKVELIVVDNKSDKVESANAVKKTDRERKSCCHYRNLWILSCYGWRRSGRKSRDPRYGDILYKPARNPG